MIHKAIYNTHSKVVRISGDSKIAFDINDNPVTLKRDLIDAEVKRLQEEFDNDYSRKRESEYPSLQECVHAILDDQLDALQAKRASVKLKYPKGG